MARIEKPLIQSISDADKYLARLTEKLNDLLSSRPPLVEATLMPQFNVRSESFGATGDGIGDDYDSIQDTITHCAAMGGGIIWLPVGRYRVEQTIILPSGVRLVGESRTNTIIVNATTDSAAIACDDAQDTSIENLSVTEEGVSDTTIGIDTARSLRLTLQRVSVMNHEFGIGIQAIDCADLLVRDVDSTGSKLPFRYSGDRGVFDDVRLALPPTAVAGINELSAFRMVKGRANGFNNIFISGTEAAGRSAFVGIQFDSVSVVGDIADNTFVNVRGHGLAILFRHSNSNSRGNVAIGVSGLVVDVLNSSTADNGFRLIAGSANVDTVGGSTGGEGGIGTGGAGPDLSVVAVATATEYVITYSGSNVALSINGGSFGTPPASPITVPRPASTELEAIYSFRGTADGQTVTNSITVAPQRGNSVDTDIVTADMQVTPGATTATTTQFTVTAVNSAAGGVVPSLSFAITNTTVDEFPSAGPLFIPISSGQVLTVQRPQFGVGQAILSLRATVAGGGVENATITIPARDRDTLNSACDVRIVDSGADFVTLQVDSIPTAGQVQFVAVTGSPVTVSGPAANVPQPSGTQWRFSRPAFATGSAFAQFRSTATGYLPDQEGQEITERGRDTVPLNLQMRPGSTNNADFIFVSAIAIDPFPQGAQTINLNVETQGLAALTPGQTNIPMTSGVAIEFQIPRPAAGGAMGRALFKITAPGRVQSVDSVDVSPKTATAAGPSLSVTPTAGQDNYTIAWTGTGQVTLSIDGAADFTPPASPFNVVRNGVGGLTKNYTFKALAGGQTLTNTVTIPPKPSSADTVVPNLTVQQTGVSATTTSFQVTASNPVGGVAPTVTMVLVGCAAQGYGGAGSYTIPASTTVTIIRPAFQAGTGSVRFIATIPGGGKEEVGRTIVNAERDTLPSLPRLRVASMDDIGIDLRASAFASSQFDQQAVGTIDFFNIPRLEFDNVVRQSGESFPIMTATSIGYEEAQTYSYAPFVRRIIALRPTNGVPGRITFTVTVPGFAPAVTTIDIQPVRPSQRIPQITPGPTRLELMKIDGTIPAEGDTGGSQAYYAIALFFAAHFVDRAGSLTPLSGVSTPELVCRSTYAGGGLSGAYHQARWFPEFNSYGEVLGTIYSEPVTRTDWLLEVRVNSDAFNLAESVVWSPSYTKDTPPPPAAPPVTTPPGSAQ